MPTHDAVRRLEPGSEQPLAEQTTVRSVESRHSASDAQTRSGDAGRPNCGVATTGPADGGDEASIERGRIEDVAQPAVR